jgi:hypothetical protein
MINPDVPRVLIDYEHACQRFGPLDFADFIVLWYAADDLMQAGIRAGLAPDDVSDLLLSDPLIRDDDE